MNSSSREAFWRGMRLPWEAAGLLWRARGVKRYIPLPLLLNAFVFLVVAAIFIWWIGRWEWGEVHWVFWGDTGAWLSAAVNKGLWLGKWILLLPAFLVGCYFSFTSVGMVIASPLNDLLSERVEHALCRPTDMADTPFRLAAWATVWSVLDSLRILLAQAFFSLLVLPFLLIPVIGVAPLFLVTAYFTGLGFVEACMARNYLRLRHKRLLAAQNRWEILGMGVAMELIFMLIPLTGLLFLPLGVTAGTILYCRFDWESALRESNLESPPGFRIPRIAEATPPPTTPTP